MSEQLPSLLVFSSLFPSSVQPGAGVFIRERMFRVAEHTPLAVVAPQAWFPFQGLIQCFVPHYRRQAPSTEVQSGVPVYRPRFLAIPGMLRRLDGISMAVSSFFLVRRLVKERGIQMIDAHFGYPDGYAATRLGRWLKLPVLITLRGTEPRHGRTPGIAPRLRKALRDASKIITVSMSLKKEAVALGIEDEKIIVVGNGVDADKFYRVDTRESLRTDLGIPADAKVLITVGGLVERKGFHRVLSVMPRLKENHDVHYLVVGGATAEGDWGEKLRTLAAELGLQDRVHFLGSLPHEELRKYLSAADVFVLSTRNEGWANVILEAMACGLPVVATDVGGNREVVCNDNIGSVIPFDDESALYGALNASLQRDWNTDEIVGYARKNSWSERIDRLLGIYRDVYSRFYS